MGINVGTTLAFASAGMLGGMGISMQQAGTAAARETDNAFASAGAVAGGVGGMLVGLRQSNVAVSNIAMDGITTGGRIAGAGAFAGAMVLGAIPGFLLAKGLD